VKCLFSLARAYSVPVIGPIVGQLDGMGPPADYRFLVDGEARAHVPEGWDRARIIGTLEEARAFNPDFVLTAETTVDFRIPGIKVQLFHGVGVEKEAHFRIRHFFDLYLTSGPLVTRRFEALARKHGYFQVMETGWPKFDHILGYRSPGPDSPHRRSGIRTVVLYAPTFSRRLQSAGALAELLPSLARDDEHWLLKFHELMPPDVVDRVRDLGRRNFEVVGSGDITPHLHAADVMISDTSSVVYEFLALGKPVITYRARRNVEKALNIETPEELRPALDLLIENPGHGREAREAMLRQVNPYLEGNVAANVMEALERVRVQGLDRSRGKPTNLFRKARLLVRAGLGRVHAGK
jgi:CDP-glycerol glycerophosphotransferase (TagB/SpsB family)